MFLELFCCCCCCCCCCCSSSSSSSFSLTARFGSRSLAMRFCLKTPRKGPSIGGGYWPARSIGCCDVGGRSWFDSGRSHWSAGASTSLGREMPSGDETRGRGGGTLIRLIQRPGPSVDGFSSSSEFAITFRKIKMDDINHFRIHSMGQSKTVDEYRVSIKVISMYRLMIIDDVVSFHWDVIGLRISAINESWSAVHWASISK